MWKWFRRLLAGLAVIVGGAAAFVYVRSETLRAKRYDLNEPALKLSKPPDLVRGRHLAFLTGCLWCHGEDLRGGRELPGARLFGTKIPGNLTLLSARWADQDFVRVLRRGVLPDGTSLIVMPAEMFAALSDDDVASIIAFVRSQPAGGHSWPPEQETVLKRIMVATGMAPYQAEILSRPEVRPLDLGPATAEGRYLAAIACVQCHARDLGGRPTPPLFPSFAPPDLRTVSNYTLEAFIDLLRAGRGPADRSLPVHAGQSLRFKELNDVEIDKLYGYLTARAATMAKPKA